MTLFQDKEEFDVNHYNQLCKEHGRVSLEVQSYLLEHEDNPQAQQAQILTNLFLRVLRMQDGAIEYFDGTNR